MDRHTNIHRKIKPCRNCGSVRYTIGNGQPFCCEPCKKEYVRKIAERIRKERKNE